MDKALLLYTGIGTDGGSWWNLFLTWNPNAGATAIIFKAMITTLQIVADDLA
jgi:hypothetical protein